METKTKIVALLLLVVYLFTLYGLLKQQIVIFLLFMPRLKKVAGYYVIPFDILSVCPSVCPSVRPSVRPSAVHHSCPLHNFNTVRNNFTKPGTNIKHDQMICRD